MKIFISQFFIVCVLALPVWAVDLSQMKSPLDVQADELDVRAQDGRASFRGNVRAVQGDLTLNCADLTVLYRDGAKDGVDKIIATGSVRLMFGEDEATGDKATYNLLEQKLYLEGDVVLKRAQNTLQGTKLVYDMATGKVNLKSEKVGRVKARIVPGQGLKLQ